MIAAHAQDKTTMLLSAEYWPVMFITASQAFKQLMRNRVLAMVRNPAEDNLVTVEPYFDSYSWKDWQYVEDDMVPKDTPCLRSCLREWPVPTVCRIIDTHKGVHPHERRHLHRKAAHVPFRFVLEFYDYTCQICHEVKPAREFSREHVFPRHLGGSNDDFNISLTCKDCNSKKAHTYPYYDKAGKELKGQHIPTWLMHLTAQVEEIRPEWGGFLLNRKVKRRHLTPKDMTKDAAPLRLEIA